MHSHAENFTISAMSRVFAVSRDGYYRWVRRQRHPSPVQQRRFLLDRHVTDAFAARKGRSGAPGLTHDLRAQGHNYNRKAVAASLRRQHLRAKAARKFKATTNSKHDLPVAPNLLQQDFSAPAPNRKWVGEITYLWTGEGWLYLAVVIDLFSRLVVGWAMSERITAGLVCEALHMALWRRRMPKGLIVHSDRGSQYCSLAYQALITKYALVCSMSAKGNCYDNACAESFFHTLKVEVIHGEYFATRDEMRRTVFEYIEVDYNRNRRHSTNGYLSPEVFEAQLVPCNIYSFG
jgi:transposase InsO family protein